MNMTKRMAQSGPTTAPPMTAARIPGWAKNEAGLLTGMGLWAPRPGPASGLEVVGAVGLLVVKLLVVVLGVGL